MLAQPAHVFAVLAERLDKRETPYAGILHALVALAGGKLDSEALQEIQEREPDEDPARIDEEWEEAPVTFNAEDRKSVEEGKRVSVSVALDGRRIIQQNIKKKKKRTPRH